MKTIYLHIGMHKTGSTAIQSAFNGFDNGYTKYANLGYENHSIPFFTAYSGQHQHYHIWKTNNLTAEQIERKRIECLRTIERELSSKEQKDIIISGEDISILPPSAVEKLNKKFGSEVNIQVIVYVRDPVSFIQSNFQENIKSGIKTSKPLPPQYRFRIQKFIEVFGRENVTVKKFERAELFEHDIVQDFAKLVGVRPPQYGRDSNETLSTEAIKVLYLLNQLVSPFDKSRNLVRTRQHMVNHVRETFPGKFDLPAPLVSSCIDFADVDWLYSETGIDFRMSITSVAPFSVKELDAYLSTLAPDTIAKIGDYLKRECGLAFVPQDTKFLLARYFMSFVDLCSKTSIMFDSDLYLKLNPDVKAAGVNPYKHYLLHGIKEGRRIK
ncbi:hypothetical protein [Celeribacter halophilus]|uniref:hypothetical protein n=1 Tax=Celeribacter halophilus TaxID=576117 RepID=UPI001C0957BA|nr:hypothetical protein [Celeribacter halophilus]MBU2888864.1 hypothetical protein [Celeribacter halophilus]MDO6511982.1 hypothetical protein [Celeribacter halophilus]